MLHPLVKKIAASIKKTTKNNDLSVEEAMERFSVSRDIALLGFRHAGIRAKLFLIKRADLDG